MPKYYLLDENKNLVEGFDKEGFLALLEQAIEDGSLENIDENSAVASKIKSLLNGTTHNIEFVTQAQYNQLEADEELVANTYYFITDDTTAEDLEAHLNQTDEAVESLNEAHMEVVGTISNILDGIQAVGYANNAENTDISNNSWGSINLVSGQTATIPDFSNTNAYLFGITGPDDHFYCLGLFQQPAGVGNLYTPIIKIAYSNSEYSYRVVVYTDGEVRVFINDNRLYGKTFYYKRIR